eukprot:s3776_g3.t1
MACRSSTTEDCSPQVLSSHSLVHCFWMSGIAGSGSIWVVEIGSAKVYHYRVHVPSQSGVTLHALIPSEMFIPKFDKTKFAPLEKTRNFSSRAGFDRPAGSGGLRSPLDSHEGNGDLAKDSTRPQLIR